VLQAWARPVEFLQARTKYLQLADKAVRTVMILTERARPQRGNREHRPCSAASPHDGTKIKKQDGTPIAETQDPAVAEDIADRLNEDDARREEDKWSA
jgi:hypothetical protein